MNGLIYLKATQRITIISTNRLMIISTNRLMIISTKRLTIKFTSSNKRNLSYPHWKKTKQTMSIINTFFQFIFLCRNKLVFSLFNKSWVIKQHSNSAMHVSAWVNYRCCSKTSDLFLRLGMQEKLYFSLLYFCVCRKKTFKKVLVFHCPMLIDRDTNRLLKSIFLHDNN